MSCTSPRRGMGCHKLNLFLNAQMILSYVRTSWNGVGSVKRRAMYNTGPIPFMKRIFPSLGESEEPGTNLAVSKVGTITLVAC